MMICLSTNVPLNADHGLLFCIFIRALVLSTFWIWKVKDLLFTDFFIPSSPCEMRFFCYSTCMKKSLNLKFYFYFFFVLRHQK